MASLIDELIDTLEKENAAYQDLLKLSVEKTDIIVKGNVEALHHIVEQEEILITNMVQPLEKKRQECTKDISIVISRKTETLTLTRLTELMAGQPEVQKKLHSIHERLKDTMQEMKRVNEMNQGLLQESLELVQFDMNLLNGLKQAPITANYDRHAYNVGERIRVPGAFDKSQ